MSQGQSKSKFSAWLLDTIQEPGLDVSWDIGLHVGIGPHDEFVKIVGQPAKN